MTVDKDRLIIELGSKLTEAAKIYAEITKDHSPAEQSVEKRTQEVFGESSVTIPSVKFKCPCDCKADVVGPEYRNPNDASSEYWQCSNNAEHCELAWVGDKVRPDGSQIKMPKKWFRFWEGKPSYNFPDEWEQVLQSQQEVNTAAAKATAEEDSSHPFDENSDNDETLNAEDIF